jgi:sugar-specific transcriptional regulator TrmB
MIMPRTVQDILDHAEELAKRFEEYEPSTSDERNPQVFTELREAVLSRSAAERSIKDAVEHAREHGYSWSSIGSLIGTSGEAARQRYGHKLDA